VKIHQCPDTPSKFWIQDEGAHEVGYYWTLVLKRSLINKDRLTCVNYCPWCGHRLHDDLNNITPFLAHSLRSKSKQHRCHGMPWWKIEQDEDGCTLLLKELFLKNITPWWKKEWEPLAKIKYCPWCGYRHRIVGFRRAVAVVPEDSL